jgi:adenosylmethionine-8-amino-7-oxononanoate aminotransferase
MKEILSFTKTNLENLEVVKSENYHITLNNGKVLIDTMSGLWCSPLGYSCQPLKDAMYQQSLINPYQSNFLGHHNEITEIYSSRLCDLANMHNVYFTNSGSSAVETAIKIACHISKNTTGVASKHSYHGSTILSAAASDQTINSWSNIADPLIVNKFSNSSELEAALKNDVAFAILEPIIAAGGVYSHSGEVFEVLKDYQSKGLIVIWDETVTGFGKLGTWFAKDYFQFEPDIMVLAKGISNGYFPLGACLIKEHVAERIKFFNHGFTFSGHPIGSAVGLEVINQLSSMNLDHSRFKRTITHNKVIEHRVQGCMGAIEFSSKSKAFKFVKSMREQGYMIESASENLNSIVYCLPYIFTDLDFENFIKTSESIINDNL